MDQDSLLSTESQILNLADNNEIMFHKPFLNHFSMSGVRIIYVPVPGLTQLTEDDV